MALECGSPGQGQGSPLVRSHWVQVSGLLLLLQITKTGWRALDRVVPSDAPHPSLCPLGTGSCGNGGQAAGPTRPGRSLHPRLVQTGTPTAGIWAGQDRVPRKRASGSRGASLTGLNPTWQRGTGTARH